MLREIGELYRSSWRFAVACPLLFAVPVIAEMVQHAAELHVGMYESFKAAEAVESDGLRMATGFAKTLALALPGYWFLRYLAHGMSGAAARTLEPRALRLFAGVLAWGVAWSIVGLWGGAPLRAVGVGKDVIFGFGVATFLALTVLELYLAPWKTGAANGNAALGFRRSIGLVRGHFWWSLGTFVLAFLPLIVLHYALAIVAIGRPEPVVIAILVGDSILVGFLALTMIGSSFLIARRATQAAGVALLPDDAVTQAEPTGILLSASSGPSFPLPQGTRES